MYFIAPSALAYILHIFLFLLQHYPEPLTTKITLKHKRRQKGARKGVSGTGK